jgi:8-oxo-dGTP diphosphatase
MAVEVAVAVLRRPDGSILLCQRPAEARYGGKWELPGGKLEPGETHLEALRRELVEELGIECGEGRLLESVETRYPDGGTFAVRFYLLEEWTGDPRPLAASGLVWAGPASLGEYEILEGSRDVLRLLESAAGSTGERISSRT